MSFKDKARGAMKKIEDAVTGKDKAPAAADQNQQQIDLPDQPDTAPTKAKTAEPAKFQPSEFDCIDRLEDGEPYFVLRGRDATAPALVRQWIRFAQQNPRMPKAKLRDAERVAAAMEAYPDAKLPD